MLDNLEPPKECFISSLDLFKRKRKGIRIRIKIRCFTTNQDAEGRGSNEDDNLRMHTVKNKAYFLLPEAENGRNKGRIIILCSQGQSVINVQKKKKSDRH